MYSLKERITQLHDEVFFAYLETSVRMENDF